METEHISETIQTIVNYLIRLNYAGKNIVIVKTKSAALITKLSIQNKKIKVDFPH